MSPRKLKVGNSIRCALIEALSRGKIFDSRLSNSKVSITRVEISSDLKVANCYVVAAFGINKIAQEDLLDALNANKQSLRYIVTNKISLKYSPELRFIYDYSFEKFEEVQRLLQIINN